MISHAKQVILDSGGSEEIKFQILQRIYFPNCISSNVLGIQDSRILKYSEILQSYYFMVSWLKLLYRHFPGIQGEDASCH